MTLKINPRRRFIFALILSFFFLDSASAFTCAEPMNVAAAANGATATASSAYSGFAASGAINGDRRGLYVWQNGYWSTAAAGFPAWLEVQFNGSKTISEVDIITVQDNYTTPLEPTESMTFSVGGLSGYEVQYWTGSAWSTINGGMITGNNKVWRKITFTALTTTRIRVLANASPDNYSRLVEVEAWTAPSPSPRYNLALASFGAVATASNSYNAGYGPAGTNNGDRKSLNWTNGGGWNDSGPPFPDWLQIDFGSVKTIDEVDVFTLQDNYANSAEPTESMTFSLWGLTSYEVQYWNGSTWVTVPNGNVSGNNKIWRKVTFSPIVTSKIRVLTNASVDGYSRITEVEAYAPQGSSCGEISRLDPLNATGGGGENPLSQNFNWNLPLVTLPGRAGMDLGLTLSYNSLVWSRNNSTITFDGDNGFPGPGFRLGFPVIQPLHYNPQTGKQGFILIGTDGSRTELRQVDSSLLFEAADSSHLLLDANEMKLLTADGTQLSYVLLGNEFKCTQIKDRNGNYITIDYVSGRLDKVIDTLGRQVRFNYNSNGLLTSITQTWNQGLSNQVEHPWARFTYVDTTIQRNFPGLTVNGPADNSSIKTLSSVTLADDSQYQFAYTSWGQVWKISRVAATGSVLNYRAYKLPGSPLLPSSPQSDCPRLTERRDWARYWNGDVDGTTSSTEEAVTSFSGPVDDTWTMPGETQTVSGKRTQITHSDGTVDSIYFVGTSSTPRWSRGLPALVETTSGGVWQRKVKTTWTQDNTNVDYPLNPRVVETNIYDPAGNRARTQITYQQFIFGNGRSCWLPHDVFEYAADASTILRTTRTNYNTDSSYTDRRIIGLPSQKLLYEGNANVPTPIVVSKVEFNYDGDESIQGNDLPVQHDTSYSSSFVVGRANLSSVKRYNVNNAESTTTSTKYNTAGAIVSSTDASNHVVQISYADSFSDNNNSRGTFAYPTTVTDEDGYRSKAKYSFDFGVVTYRRTPLPNLTDPNSSTPGPEQTFTFDSIGRPQQTTNLVNNSYTRFVYSPTQSRLDIYRTIQDGLGEAHAFQITDGVGRVIASAAQHPGSQGGYSAHRMIYDVMGRVFKTSNPTETDVVGATPFDWAATGDDSAWVYTEQTYDWKGRPLRTTHPDTTYREAAYAGCGCAGGEVVTLTDEGTIDGGVEKRRQQKIYTDVLGRQVKIELLNWSGGSIYSTTVNTYNVRDQLMEVKQYAGPAGSSTLQTTTMTYDGYARLSSRHVPEQNSGTATVWTYNADDTASSITDARGATTALTYNARHLVTNVSYSAPAGIVVPSAVGYQYDGAGNRTWMSDGSGSTSYQYDLLSQMISETRVFSGLSGSYTLSYEYTVAGQLKSLTDHTNQRVNYGYDAVGRLNSLTGTNYNSNQFINSYSYRAWGAYKQIVYGNGRSQSVNYNTRLQPTHFEVPGYQGFGTAMSIDFDYFNDGRLKFANNNLDDRFDRSYEYDHAGRLTKALSGAEARGEPATTNRPYKETASFDEFGHLKTRSSLHWSRTLGFGSSDTYVDNKRVGWSYDLDGNWLSGAGRQHTYDAAGRSTTTTWTGGGSFNQFYDGDDQRVKTTESNLVTYYLRSSVLGGSVIEELDSRGVKQKGFIYERGKLVGHQSANGNVSILHEDPSGRSIRSSTPTASLIIDWAELDPWGAEVFAFDPYAGDPSFSGGRGEGGPVFPGFGDISMPSTGCSLMLDGVLTLCDFASRNVNGGGIAMERRNRDGTRQLLPLSTVLGIKLVWHEPRAGNSSMDIYDTGDGDPVIRTNNSFPGFWETIVDFEQQKLPQKPVDWSVLESSLKTCIRDLWPFEVTSVKWTKSAGEGGKADDDTYNGAIGLRDIATGTNFTVVNDPSPPPDVKAMLIKTKSRGATPKQNPFWTYAYPRADSTPRPGDLRYPELFDQMEVDYARVQIHETAAALSAIRNIYHPGPWAPRLPDGGLDPTHPDDGPSLEDCVGRHYYKQMGLKPH